ncbi:MAG: hypothetical protein ACREBG_23830 [Pyrinomonadaceae bacterium]
MYVPGQRVSRDKHTRIFLAILGLLSCFGADIVQAQALKVRITVTSLSPAAVLIEGEGPPADSWSFGNTYGGITGLGERIEHFSAVGSDNNDVAVREVAPGEFRASRKASRFRYEIEAGERPRLAEMSHVSWLNKERGFLMLADLLPLAGRGTPTAGPTVIEFKLPADWTIATDLRPDENQQYLVSQKDTAVFYVGSLLREKKIRVDSMELILITSGEWAFADDEAVKLAGEVIKQYAKLTKYRLPGRSALMLAPFSGSIGPDRWSAETRGSSTVLMLGRNGNRRAMLSRLGVVLTHELFHLWVPNALALDGDYDWFFEGFTLYQALITALRLKLIDFEDYLDTMSRVYDSYLSLPDRDRFSLIEASERRWTASPSFIYDKGMLVAFVYDLMLRQDSRNRASLANIYRQLFTGSAGGRRNANEVIMSLLNRPDGMNGFGERYIRSPIPVGLKALLAPYGLRVETTNFRTRIVVDKELGAAQRSLLRSLGYRPNG